MRTLLALPLIAVSLMSFAACGGAQSASSPSAADDANAPKSVGEKVVDQAKACAEQTVKLKACDQLGMVAKALCRRAADKGACLGR